MNPSSKAMEWLICFSIINLMLACLLFKKFKKFIELLNISKKASYIIGNEKFSGEICILNLRNKKKYLCKSNHYLLRVKEDRKENEQDYN